MAKIIKSIGIFPFINILLSLRKFQLQLISYVVLIYSLGIMLSLLNKVSRKPI